MYHKVLLAYANAHSHWHGCDWETSFGLRQLNLRGITARQATLIANATAGQESQAWRAAARWLDEIETKAQRAEELAREALAAAIRGNIVAALESACRARDLEAAYHGVCCWNDLVSQLHQLSEAACLIPSRRS